MALSTRKSHFYFWANGRAFRSKFFDFFQQLLRLRELPLVASSRWHLYKKVKKAFHYNPCRSLC